MDEFDFDDWVDNFWLMNDERDRFIRFAVYIEKDMSTRVSVIEYRIMGGLGQTIDSPSCTLEPFDKIKAFRFTRSRAEEIWMAYVRDGFRMLTEVVGKIETEKGYKCCWLTLRSALHGSKA